MDTQAKPTDIRHLSGINPFSAKPDDPKRFDLFNRLRKFYSQFDAVRVTTGIGEIVDWTLRNGEDALNQRLLIKYGANLKTLEEEMGNQTEMQEEEAELKSLKEDMKEKSTTGPSFASSTKGGSKGLKPSMRQVLTEFYKKHEPEKIEKGLDDIIEYVARKGLDALNKKLMKKYGECLDMSDEVKVNQSGSHSSFTPFFTTIAQEEVEEPEIKETPKIPEETRGPPPPPPSRHRSANTEQKTIATPTITPIEPKPQKLPAYIKPTLNLYYSLYDPTKLTNGGIGVILKWTKHKGVDALNRKLKEKYNESLDEFAGRANTLRDELIEFYTRVDRMKLVKGLDDVLKWCLRNGRGPLNDLLRKKYGVDLDSNNQEEEDDKEPEPVF